MIHPLFSLLRADSVSTPLTRSSLFFRSPNMLQIFVNHRPDEPVPRRPIPNLQRLTGTDGKSLDDRLTLADYRIKNGASLFLGFHHFDASQILFQALTGKTITFVAEPSATVKSVKEIVAAMVTNLVFFSDELESRDAENGPTLRVEVSPRGDMQIFVKSISSRGRFLCKVSSADTIGKVKAKIPDKIEISPVLLDLVFDGKTLDDRDSLADHGVRTESILFVSLRGS